MTLGDCIREFREANDISQRQFAEACDLSNAYISILEKNVNPKTGEAPVPTYGVYSKVAKAMGTSVQKLMEKANESSVSLGSNTIFDVEIFQYLEDLKKFADEFETRTKKLNELEIVNLFQAMNDNDKEKLLDYARYIVNSYHLKDKVRGT